MTRERRYPVVMATLLVCMSTALAADDPSLIPWPKEIHVDGGVLAVTENTRIVAQNKDLAPLAGVLSEEIARLTGLRLKAEVGTPAAGDIALSIDPALPNEKHKVVVSDRVTVQGGNYVGVAMGTATVLQALRPDGRTFALPRMTVVDWPFAPYTGTMHDIARRLNSIDDLKQLVVLARLYKMKYVHLHMTDDQLFTFPSTKFAAKLPGVYKLDELKGLVKFADDRGVTIVPELELPGHSGALRGALPDLVGGPDVVDFFRKDSLPTLETLIGEMCDVFKSSPYFHMGSDECQWGGFESQEHVAADRKSTGRNTPQQYAWFMNQVNAMIKKQGKKTICWEGFEPGYEPDKDIIVMSWDGRVYPPAKLVAAGYSIINVPWWPQMSSPARENYEWNLWQAGSQDRKPDELKRTDPVLGGEMVLWECPGHAILPNHRTKAVARHERIHSPDAGRTYEDFARRFASTDRILDLLVHGYTMEAQGLQDPCERVFGNSLTLTVVPSPAIKDLVVRYTKEPWTDPAANSPVVTGPMTFEAGTWFTTQAFDSAGKPVGFPRLMWYSCQPITGIPQAAFLPEERWRDRRFREPFDVVLKSTVPGEIRYTLDGTPPDPVKSPVYAKPVRIEAGRSASLQAALFVDGKRKGDVWGQGYTWVDFEKNLTTGRPVKYSNGKAWITDSPVVDGLVSRDVYMGAPTPMWVEVDLGKPFRIGEVRLYTWWGDGRVYQHVIEVSTDDTTWKTVADASKNSGPSGDQGYRHAIEPVSARYVRATITQNSANDAGHISELRVYEAK